MSKVRSKDVEKKDNNIARPIYFTIFITMLILISIAYASLAINFGIKVNGVQEIEDVNWDIHFENIKVTNGSVRAIKPATIDKSKTGVNYSVNLSLPGEFYSFKVDIVNDGDVDAKIYEIIEKSITNRQKQFIDYEVKYINGAAPKKEDVIEAGRSKTLFVKVKFKDNITAADLPGTAQRLDLSYNIVYVEK